MSFGNTLWGLAVFSMGCGGTVLIDGSGGAGGATTVGSTSKATVGSTSNVTVGVTASSVTTSTGPMPQFIQDLEAGPWLMGYSGGLEHFSWVRFTGFDGAQGQVWILDPVSTPGFVPFFVMCQGQGSFTADITQSSATITFPPSCALPPQTFFFQIGTMPLPIFPKAVMGASIIAPPSQIAMDGARFPDGFCTAPLVSCPDPTK